MQNIFNKCCAVLLGLLLLCAVMAQSATVHDRQARNTPTTKPKRECDTDEICGWAVYTPFTRQINYFVQNTCTCNDIMKCLKKFDDVSVSAYVFKCSPPSTPQT